MSTIVDVPTGMFRAALAAVVPHAGKDTDDTPLQGRVRIHLTATHLVVWATDMVTSALARVEITEHHTGELDGCDLPVDSVRKVLAVFTPPSHPDSRSVWVDEPLRVEIDDHHVTVTEVGSIVQGEKLTVTRLVPAGEDKYPDVPTLLSGLVVLATDDSDGHLARPDMSAMARFTAGVKAYASTFGSRPLLYVLPAGDRAVLTRIGNLFLGSCPSQPEEPEKAATGTRWWTGELTPLRRRVEKARANLRVVPAGADQ